MKKILFPICIGLAMFLMLSLQSCETVDPCSNLECQNGGYCTSGECNCPDDYYGEFCQYRYTGDVAFWTNSTTNGYGNIDIYVSGDYAGTLRKYYESTPNCENASDVIRFTANPGTYTYYAVSGDGHTWNGTITVDAGGCGTFLLYSSAGAKGQTMFWANQNLGCGFITVNVAGQSGTISSYYSSGTPTCEAAGCATFSLSPATYSFTASCTGKSWSGTVVVTANNCYKMRLDP